MAKLTLQNITSGYASATTQNANNDAIETALENTLSRDGTSPNAMNTDLDMNGYSILNAAGIATTGDNSFIGVNIHAATDKNTPIDADEIPISDSVASWGLKKLSWANLKTTLSSVFASISGSISQTFAVGFPSTFSDAARLEQVSLYPSVASATTMDIFGADGTTIDVTGTTTVTGITTCSAAQVGSTKRLIPSNASGFSITASANLIVDGATSGTFLMPQNSLIEILATSTTTFTVITIFAQGAFTPGISFGGAAVGVTYSEQTGRYIKVGNKVDYSITLALSAKGSSTGAARITNLPFTCNAKTHHVAPPFSTGIVTVTTVGANVEASSTSILLHNANVNYSSSLLDSNVSNNSLFRLAGTYFV